MKCPVCVEAGVKSTLRSGGTMTTLMCGDRHYDEDGNLHDHDPNEKTTAYSCSRGHNFAVNRISECPSCNYGKGSERVLVITAAAA